MSAKRTLVDYMYNKNYAPENCNWLGIWIKIIQDSFKLCWLRQSSFGTPELVYLCDQLEKRK